jgi:hypothetical protein
MSAAKMQKSLFESAKCPKLKEFKYDANPSVCRWLFKSFMVSWSAFSVEKNSFKAYCWIILKFIPSMIQMGHRTRFFSFMLILTYVDEHFKMVIQRKDTNGFSDKAILELQAKCASITAFETHSTHCEFTGLPIVPRESISAYLSHFSIAHDKAEDAGNKYDNDTLVDCF